jgi:hypothetical protein
MKQDRFLLGILIGIGVLILAALIVFFSRQNRQTFGSETIPDGVVHNYILAVLNGNYQKAYGYLADLEYKPSYDTFRRSFATGTVNPSDTGVTIGKTDVTGEDATVEVNTMNTQNDPFSSQYNNTGSAALVKQNGGWKILSMTAYNLWDSNWYQALPK